MWAEIIDVIVLFLGQLTYWEGKCDKHAKAKQSPEEIYNANKAAFDKAFANRDTGALDVLIDGVLPSRPRDPGRPNG
jgi:hypothetical protein